MEDIREIRIELARLIAEAVRVKGSGADAAGLERLLERAIALACDAAREFEFCRVTGEWLCGALLENGVAFPGSGYGPAVMMRQALIYNRSKENYEEMHAAKREWERRRDELELLRARDENARRAFMKSFAVVGPAHK